MMGEDDFF